MIGVPERQSSVSSNGGIYSPGGMSSSPRLTAAERARSERGAAIEGAAIRIGHELVGGWCVRERWCSHRHYHKGTTQISRRNGLEQLDDRMPTMRSGVHAQGFSWRVLPVRTVPMPAVRSLRLPA